MIITDEKQIKKNEIYYIASIADPEFAVVKSLGNLTDEEFPDSTEKMPWHEGLPVFKIIFGQLKSLDKDFRLNKNTLVVHTQLGYKIITKDDKYEVMKSLFYAYA